MKSIPHAPTADLAGVHKKSSPRVCDHYFRIILWAGADEFYNRYRIVCFRDSLKSIWDTSERVCSIDWIHAIQLGDLFCRSSI